MREMSAREAKDVNGGEFLAILAGFGLFVGGWLWVMGKMGDYGINAVRQMTKKR